MTNGWQEEVDADPEGCSPLFKGGKGDLIHTATTLSGVNNGTLLSDGVNDGERIRLVAGALFVPMVILGDVKAVRKFWDFQFDQWNIMQKRAEVTGKFKNPLKLKKEIKQFLSVDLDNIGQEMKVIFAKELNDLRGDVNPNTYYFARRAVKSHEIDPVTHKHDMDPHCYPVMSALAGKVTGHFINDNLKNNYGVDLATWAPNDGFVNLPGQSAPFTQPSVEAASFNEDFKPGIWYNMPVEYKDHLSWVGPMEDKQETLNYYLDMQKLFESLD